jgi:hypothetical protein
MAFMETVNTLLQVYRHYYDLLLVLYSSMLYFPRLCYSYSEGIDWG